MWNVSSDIDLREAPGSTCWDELEVNVEAGPGFFGECPSGAVVAPRRTPAGTFRALAKYELFVILIFKQGRQFWYLNVKTCDVLC